MRSIPASVRPKGLARFLASSAAVRGVVACGVVVCGGAVVFPGCGEEVPIIPRGAWYIEFQDSGSKCEVAYHKANVGTVGSKGELELKANGSDSADVACSVKASGGGYAVSGEVTYKGQYLSVEVANLKKDQTFEDPAKGRIELQTGTTAEAYSSSDCIVYFVDDQLVDKGKVWASFQCPEIVGPNASTCEIVQGYFAFELCDGTQTEEDGGEEE